MTKLNQRQQPRNQRIKTQADDATDKKLSRRARKAAKEAEGTQGNTEKLSPNFNFYRRFTKKEA